MIIAGAGGHALEIYNECSWLGIDHSISFYDETRVEAGILHAKPILFTKEQLKDAFKSDARFIIGVGAPGLRKHFYESLTALGGSPFNLISQHARIGQHMVSWGNGINLMAGASLTIEVSVGKGTLIHMNATLHHHCVVGDFCEISPGAQLLGKVRVGNYVSIGTGAIILPGIQIGDKAIIGAGAVVTKNVAQGQTVAGVPAISKIL